MDRIADQIFIGSSSDGIFRHDERIHNGITAVFNVAKDLTNQHVTHEMHRIDHVGLVDGAGNPKGLLYASVATLAGLISNGYTVLVHCHEGRSRSVMVVATYLRSAGHFPDITSALEYLKSKRPRIGPKESLVEEFEALDPDILKKIVQE